MRRTELQILEQLEKEPLSVTELARLLDKNQGWISELVANLEDQNLATKNRTVDLEDNYEAQLLRKLLTDYTLEDILAGKKEDILKALLDEPRTASELETQGFAQSTVYQNLKQLRATGALRETDEGYEISDETLRDFLTARTTAKGTRYTSEGETILRVRSGEDVAGVETAFSAFTRYGVEYYPNDQYRYQDNREELDLEDVLIHAVKLADSRRQMGIAGVFYLTHSGSLDNQELWRLARKWDCVERLADLLAFLDQRDVHQGSLFLSWDEFADLANEYNVYPREKHPEDSLLNGMEVIGESLPEPVDTYLLGGGNLILRGLKDSTKDIDLVVDSRNDFTVLADALRGQGFSERTDLEHAYEALDPSIILTKEGFPNWDIFVEEVAGKLHLTDSMKDRVDETHSFANVELHLLSLTDIFLFKSVTEREGDLEDAALIARRGAVDWDALFDEVQRQEDVTDRYFSFDLLDTLDIIEERDAIKAPIHQRLVSYCLENALLRTLEESKTIHDLREELDFPDHQIYNKLRKLEDEERIEVDRSGKLNRYQVREAIWVE